jgi:hypothetical protein
LFSVKSCFLVSAAGGISRGFSASCFVLADFCCSRFLFLPSRPNRCAHARRSHLASRFSRLSCALLLVFYFLRARSPPAELFSATDFPHRFLQGDLSPRAWFFFCPRTRFVISCPCCQAAGVHRRNLPAAISSSSWFPRPIFISAAGFQCRSVLLSLRFLRHAGGCFIAAEYSRPRRWVPSQPGQDSVQVPSRQFFRCCWPAPIPCCHFSS